MQTIIIMGSTDNQAVPLKLGCNGAINGDCVILDTSFSIANNIQSVTTHVMNSERQITPKIIFNFGAVMEENFVCDIIGQFVDNATGAIFSSLFEYYDLSFQIINNNQALFILNKCDVAYNTVKDITLRITVTPKNAPENSSATIILTGF